MSTTVAPRRAGSRTGTILTLLVLIVLCVMYVTPLPTLVVGSFEQAETLPSFSVAQLKGFSFDNYATFFSNGGARAILNSLVISAGVTVALLVVGVPGAYWLARTSPRIGSIALLGLIFLQMVPAASIIIPLYQVLAVWGLLGHLLGVILTLASALLPLAVLLLRPYFQGIPVEIVEAAAIDGAGPYATFTRTMLPLAANGIITTGILVFMISWGDFIYAVNFLNDPASYPAPALLTTYLGQYHADWPGLMSASIATSLPVVALFLIFQRRLSAGLSTGAVKG